MGLKLRKERIVAWKGRYPNARTCQTEVRMGMRIDTQSGNGTWRVEA